MGALVLTFATIGHVSAAGPGDVVTGCPQWMGVDGSSLFWVSQHDDRALRKMSLPGGQVTAFGKDCSTYVSGSFAVDREALYCIDENWRNLSRIDKATGAKTVLPLGKQSLGPIVMVQDDLYFAYSETRDQFGLGRVSKRGGAMQNLISVKYPLPTFAADSEGLIWLDATGNVQVLPAGQTQPKSVGKSPDCAHNASVKSECHVVADHDFIYLSFQPRCGSHDACPHDVGRIERMPRKGGSWQRLAEGLRTIQMLQLHGAELFYSDCVNGTISRLPKQGGPRRSVDASGACWAFAVGDTEVLWFNSDGTTRDWKDCRLKRAPFNSFK